MRKENKIKIKNIWREINMSLKKNMSKLVSLGLVGVLSAGILVGCGNSNQGGNTSDLKGTVIIDGSSTVFPISEGVAEEFGKQNQGVDVTVGTSGTGGGFEKFLKGEIDIANASRGIKDEEKAEAEKAGIKYKEIEVAYDGITIAVNPQNTWAKDITLDELKKIWEPNSTVKMWSDVRSEWPKEEIKLYGPGSESGTFEYFTEEVTGEAGAIRTDYTGSEDDNVLVTGVAGDKNAMGFFGYSYYYENQDKLKAISVNGVVPTQETIQNKTYAPLSRPLYIYVSEKALVEKPEVKAYVEFYLGEVGKEIVSQVGYVALPDAEYASKLKEVQEVK
jgi:phosphate transport system substrate-binding protein